MKYRKKPVVVEAVQLTKDRDQIASLVEWVHNIDMSTCGLARSATIDNVLRNGYISIPTLEGEMMASFGDYIIKGVQGEYYPCKPDIFEQNYEPA